MKTNICLFIALCINGIIHAQNDIYDVRLSTAAGETISLADFKGQSLLFVSIDPFGDPTAQLIEYRELIKYFKDSGLTIIVCPVTGLSQEKRGNDTAVLKLRQAYESDRIIVCFPAGNTEGEASLSAWLSTKNKNGIIDEKFNHNGWKYLVNRQGKLTGIFSNRVRPLDNDIIDAIKNNQ